MVELNKISRIIGGGTPSKQNDEYWTNGTVKWLSAKYIGEDQSVKGFDLITEEAVKDSATKIAPKNSTILVSRVSVGKFAFADQDYAINQDLTAIIPNEDVEPKYILYASFDLASRISNDAQGIGVRGVTRDYIERLEIPLPDIEVQKRMVEEIEKEEVVITSNKNLIEIMEKKIEGVLSEI
ncbi:MAG: restriction endonuclease subunit S [Candidatus Cloacimonetes bacterium]|nr:restriction endonuclease subunit S [Candidatus Cloacimonadota bacterium]